MEIAIVLIGLIGFAVLGFLCSRRKGLNDYADNSGQTRFLLLMPSIVATYVGGGLIVTMFAIGSEAGLAGVYLGFSYLMGFLLVAGLSKRIRDLGREYKEATGKKAISLLEIWQQKYSQLERCNAAVCVMSVVPLRIFLVFLASQLLGFRLVLGFFFRDEGVVFWVVYVAAFLVLIAYTAHGGLPAVLYTDIAQIVLVLVLAGMIWCSVFTSPKGLQLAETDPSLLLGLSPGYGVAFIIGAFLFIGPSMIVQLDAWQRVLAAKNEKTSRNAFAIAGCVILFFFVTFTVGGLLVRNTGGDAGSGAAQAYFSRLLSNPVARGVGLLALMAALLSSADSILNVLSMSVLRNLPGKLADPILVTEATGRDTGRNVELKAKIPIMLCSIAVACIAFALTLLIPGIVQLMILGTSSLLILAPATLAAMYGRSRSPTGAFTSVVIGFLLIVLLAVVLPSIYGINTFKNIAFIPAVVAAVLLYIAGWLFDKYTGRLVGDESSSEEPKGDGDTQDEQVAQ